MKNTLIIYTNFAHKNFLTSILQNYNLDFKKFEDVMSSNPETDKVLFFLFEETNESLIKQYLHLKNALLIILKT